jgi:peroxiredoxin
MKAFIVPSVLSTIALSVFAFSSSPVFAAAVVGQPAPQFELKDSKGKTVKLADLTAEKDIVVLEWLNYDCPFVKKHYGTGHMQDLQKKYTNWQDADGKKDIKWFSIISSAPGKEGNYPAKKINEMNAKKGGHATAILLDFDGKVGKAYGAKTTPHMFVIDRSGLIAYAGGIDDKPSTDADDIPVAKNFVALALDQMTANPPQAVAVTSAPPYGCSVKY